MTENSNKSINGYKVFFFAVFLLIGFGLVPVIVNFFTDRLVEVVTESEIPVWLKANAMYIVYGFWGIYVAGLAIALPAMVKDGFFSGENKENL